jgi:ABC-2 type transport system ATP-binding protein
MPAETMIQCENLTKRFGHFTAVDHVTFSVGKGSIFGFLGPNGSGKSTVIRMLCGLLTPTEGSARIAGFDVTKQLDDIKALIGYMSQKFSLYDELTVYENLQFYGRLYGLRGAALASRRDDLVAITHLEPSGWRWPVRSCTSRPCCSSTSRRRALTRWRGGSCGTCCLNSRVSA